jgi:unsaturated rhamnogalacturonyl hydrolase
VTDSGDKQALVKDALLCMARQCWEQGIAAQAMLETGDTRRLVLMAGDCVTRQGADGRLCMIEDTPAQVDPAVCVEPVLAAGRILGDARYGDAARRNIDYLLRAAPGTPDGARYQLAGAREVWADSLAMGPHVLIAAGYANEGIGFYKAVKKRLQDSRTGLVRHKWDENAQAFARPCFWGVGNGWALVGLMRMSLALRGRLDARADYTASEFASLARAMMVYQTPEGLFHDFLDDSSTYTETESTEMFAYSVFKMVKSKLLAETLLDAAHKARNAVMARVDAQGYVTGCSGSPSFDRVGTSAEGQAHFLMMEAAADALGG